MWCDDVRKGLLFCGPDWLGQWTLQTVRLPFQRPAWRTMETADSQAAVPEAGMTLCVAGRRFGDGPLCTGSHSSDFRKEAFTATQVQGALRGARHVETRGSAFEWHSRLLSKEAFSLPCATQRDIPVSSASPRSRSCMCSFACPRLCPCPAIVFATLVSVFISTLHLDWGAGWISIPAPL